MPKNRQMELEQPLGRLAPVKASHPCQHGREALNDDDDNNDDVHVPLSQHCVIVVNVCHCHTSSVTNCRCSVKTCLAKEKRRNITFLKTGPMKGIGI